jgi:hypothetical protein
LHRATSSAREEKGVVNHTRTIVTHCGGTDALRVVEEGYPEPTADEVRVLAVGVCLARYADARHSPMTKYPGVNPWVTPNQGQKHLGQIEYLNALGALIRLQARSHFCRFPGHRLIHITFQNTADNGLPFHRLLIGWFDFGEGTTK